MSLLGAAEAALSVPYMLRLALTEYHYLMN